MNLPETTIRLLRAVQASRDSCKVASGMVNRVIIAHDLPAGIVYLPAKSRYTSPEIVRAGLSEIVTAFLFDQTRHLVARHFREGDYDISGNEIRVLK